MCVSSALPVVKLNKFILIEREMLKSCISYLEFVVAAFPPTSPNVESA